MNLNTITEVSSARHRRTRSRAWRDGYAWLAGGTWLFSEPQPAIDTLIDLERLGWPALEASPDGLDIAATCRIAELYRLRRRRPNGPPRRCSASAAIRLLASFKIWNAATVGGNICMSLPAGPMISLTVALEGVCTLWPRDGAAARGRRRSTSSPATTPTFCGRANCCAASTCRPRRCAKRFAFRHVSLTQLGRSAALLIGTQRRRAATISCSPSPRRRRARSSSASRDAPSADGAAAARSMTRIPADGYFDDVHGSAAYKRHLTYYFAEQIRAELAQPGGSA